MRKEKILPILHAIAQETSDIVMKIYEGAGGFDVQTKEDRSPVTVADLKANDHITKELLKHFTWPVLSEESLVPYEERKDWQTFWMVDPIDGTKSFIKKEGDFTVNIALIEQGRPVAGVLAIPVTGDVYTASLGKGCHKNNEKITNNATRDELIVSASRAHKSKSTQTFIQNNNNIKHVTSRGSSLKFALLAEGAIDVYPRFGPTSEWDIAAGHIVCEEAGCEIYNANTNGPIEYNKENFLNPNFIACRRGLKFIV